MPHVLSNLLLSNLHMCEILLLLWMTIWHAEPHLWLTLGSKAGAQRVHRLDCDRGRAGSQASAHEVHKGVAGVEGGDVVHHFCQTLECHELAETKAHGSGSRSLWLTQVSHSSLISPTAPPLPACYHFLCPSKVLPNLQRVKITSSPGSAWDTLASHISASSCI